MEVIRSSVSIPEILRTTLTRGSYFKGAAGVYDDVEVHRAALRAAATLMRKVRRWTGEVRKGNWPCDPWIICKPAVSMCLLVTADL